MGKDRISSSEPCYLFYMADGSINPKVLAIPTTWTEEEVGRAVRNFANYQEDAPWPDRVLSLFEKPIRRDCIISTLIASGFWSTEYDTPLYFA